jgi:hypothetical protein
LLIPVLIISYLLSINFLRGLLPLEFSMTYVFIFQNYSIRRLAVPEDLILNWWYCPALHVVVCNDE